MKKLAFKIVLFISFMTLSIMGCKKMQRPIGPTTENKEFASSLVNDSIFKGDFYKREDSINNPGGNNQQNVNLIDSSKWKIWKISDNTSTYVSFNSDSSEITFTGKSYGNAGVFQAVSVEAGVHYKLDMHVKGSGGRDLWFQTFVEFKKPESGKDYGSDDNTRIGINTWSGCGDSEFDGLLSELGCQGKGNDITFLESGTAYVTIKCGAKNVGTDGIVVSDVTFKSE